MYIDCILILIYGLLLFVGAFFGWRAGSKISLFMGIFFGILVLIGVAVLRLNTIIGYFVELILSALLSAAFLMRFLKTKKIMPSGLLFAVSLSILTLCIVRLLAIY